MLNGLILFDCLPEYPSLTRISSSALDSRITKAESFRRDQNALRVHPVQDHLEHFILLTDQVSRRDAPVIEEERVCVDRGASHLWYFMDFHDGWIEIRVSEGETV